VRVQAIAMMLGSFVVGAPIGIIIGRVAWRTFASRLGVVTNPSTPIWWILATAAVAMLIALLAAAGPARIAARSEPATLLRAE
jgi:ABC-type antimicrobial peptide transport system permease subunit